MRSHASECPCQPVQSGGEITSVRPSVGACSAVDTTVNSCRWFLAPPSVQRARGAAVKYGAHPLEVISWVLVRLFSLRHVVDVADDRRVTEVSIGRLDYGKAGVF